MGVIRSASWLPKAQPISGIRAWNPPKNSEMTAACLMFRRLMPKPLQTETAKASMESPTPIKNNSANPTMILSS